jgi:predicted signal transduction protein with EAL and GGDEF domain
VAAFPEHARERDPLYLRADEAMYMAKRSLGGFAVAA